MGLGWVRTWATRPLAALWESGTESRLSQMSPRTPAASAFSCSYDDKGRVEIDPKSRAGLEPIGLHEARHTFASVLIAAGVTAKAITT